MNLIDLVEKDAWFVYCFNAFMSGTCLVEEKSLKYYKFIVHQNNEDVKLQMVAKIIAHSFLI